VLVIFLFKRLFLDLRPGSGPRVTLLVALVGAMASVALAALSWEYFEKPLVKRGHRHNYAGKMVNTGRRG